MRYIAVAALWLLALPAFAGTANITWTNATQHTDNSPIPATGAGSLARTTVEYGTCTGTGTSRSFATKVGEMWVAPTSTSLQVNMVVVQEYCFRAYHSNTFAVTFAACTAGSPGDATCPVGNSAYSSVVWRANPPSVPNPPSGLTVGASNLVAYGSQQSNERQTTYPVGTVAENTACDPTMSANGLYRVPKSAVTWAGDVRPAVVFAQCQPSGG